MGSTDNIHDQKLLIVDVLEGEITNEMETGGQVGHMVAVTADHSRAFVPHMYSDTLACFDLESGERLALVDLEEQPEGIDVRPGHDEVWVTNRASDSVSAACRSSCE